MIENLEEIKHSGSGCAEPRPMDCQAKPYEAQAILDWLVLRISENAGIDPSTISIDEPLATYAFGSIQSVSLVADLEDWLGRELPPTLLWDHPTLGEVATFLVEHAAG